MERICESELDELVIPGRSVNIVVATYSFLYHLDIFTKNKIDTYVIFQI